MGESTADSSTVARVAAVLSALGASDGRPELSGSDVARIVGRERSQVSRMLKALAAVGLVEQNPETRGYRLGWQLYVLAARAGDQRLLSKGAAVLRNVANETGETALLSVLHGNRSFTVLRERSEHTIQAGGWVGRTSPLHASASGRALLLDFDDDEVRELIEDDLAHNGLGPRALRSIPQVLELLHHERHAGYSVAVDELEAGLSSVGAPVRNITGQIVASLNISGPTFRVADRMDALAATAKVAARRLGALMARGTPQ